MEIASNIGSVGLASLAGWLVPGGSSEIPDAIIVGGEVTSVLTFEPSVSSVLTID